MSNMTFAHRIKSYADCEKFLTDAPAGYAFHSKKLTYETTVADHINWRTGTPYKYTVTHFDTAIATFHKVADMLYIPKWTDHRFGGKYANAYGIDQFPIIASFDNGGYATQTTANRLHEMVPEFAPRGLAISTRTAERESPIDGRTYPTKVMVAIMDGYEYPFDTLHFGLMGDVIAYNDGKPYRVAQRRTRDFH